MLAPTVLKGVIRDLNIEETTVDAFQGDELRNRTAITGALAASMGLSGLAAGMVTLSMSEMREGAFGVTFNVDGRCVRGVVWNCPFQDGDYVEIVAEPLDDHWNAFAIARPSDRIIALFPHVVAGRYAHYRSSLKWLAWVLAAVVGIVGVLAVSFWVLDGAYNPHTFFIGMLGGVGLGSIVISMIGLSVVRKYMPFVKMAEMVFSALGWRDVRNINLRKQTMRSIRPGDPPALGPFYFRY